jgi:hypothetical protein
METSSCPQAVAALALIRQAACKSASKLEYLLSMSIMIIMHADDASMLE